ncbi:MAG TPA: sulfatase [Planctomycetaceae bacterium]|nr:sulfatase [Planctomycetaceae bacterium]
MKPLQSDIALQESTRRHFFQNCGIGIGSLALSQLLAAESSAALKIDPTAPMAPRPGHFPGKAKNVIFLFMAGGPSQLDLFEDKPKLRELSGKTPPESLMAGKRFAFLKGNETLLGSKYKFGRYGDCGMELSELIPHHQKIVDEVCWLRGMTTDVFNHGPAKLFMNSGFQAPGRPSLGSWATYGLGSESADLPGFVVLQSGPRGPRAGASLWSSGFLPTSYQGVPFRGQGDPILHLRSPEGISRTSERHFYDAVAALNQERLKSTQDPEILTRINAYEMAFRMQTSARELMEIGQESTDTLNLYGVEPGKPSFANNCLLARRLVERGVRFVQLYHTNWDHHGGPTENLDKHLPEICREIDQASAALVLDLKQRGLLDDTLVIWAGEFGRTPMGEVRENIGRDHHVDAFTLWMAGGGVKKGYIHGESDELGFGVTEGKVHVHDLHATILNQLGFDHERLTYRFQGRDFRLTDVHGHVVNEILG